MTQQTNVPLSVFRACNLIIGAYESVWIMADIKEKTIKACSYLWEAIEQLGIQAEDLPEILRQ